MSSVIIHSLYIPEKTIIEECHEILKRPKLKIEVPNDCYDTVIEKLKAKYSGKLLKEKIIQGKFNCDQVIHITQLEKVSVLKYDDVVKGVVLTSEASLSAVLLFCCLMWNEEFVNGLEQSLLKQEKLDKEMKFIKLKKFLTLDKSKLGASGAAFVVPKAASLLVGAISGSANSSVFFAPIAGGILSSVDVYRYCDGTISKDQLMKNVVVIGAGLGSGVAGGVVGGVVGGAIGSVLLPGIGTAAGGLLGGLVGGGITNLSASYITKKAVMGHVTDDSDTMMHVFRDTMMETIALFIMTPKETAKFGSATRKEISVKSFLREMFKATNRGNDPEKAKIMAFQKFMEIAREVLIEERMEIMLEKKELGMIAEAQEELLEMASTASTATQLYRNNFDSPHELANSEKFRTKVTVNQEMSDLYFSNELKLSSSSTTTKEEEEKEGEGEEEEEEEEYTFLRDVEEGGLPPWEYFNVFEGGDPDLVLCPVPDEGSKKKKKKNQNLDLSMFPSSSSSYSGSSSPFRIHPSKSKQFKSQVIKKPDILPTYSNDNEEEEEEETFEKIDLENEPLKKPKRRKKVAPPPPPSKLKRARREKEATTTTTNKVSVETTISPPRKKFVIESVKVGRSSNIVDVHPSLLPVGMFNQLTLVDLPPLDACVEEENYHRKHHSMKVKRPKFPPRDLKSTDPHPNQLVPFEYHANSATTSEPLVVDCVKRSDNILHVVESSGMVVDMLQYLERHRKKENQNQQEQKEKKKKQQQLLQLERQRKIRKQQQEQKIRKQQQQQQLERQSRVKKQQLQEQEEEKIRKQQQEQQRLKQKREEIRAKVELRKQLHMKNKMKKPSTFPKPQRDGAGRTRSLPPSSKLPKTTDKYFCEVCKISFPFFFSFQQHKKGKQHLKIVKAMNKPETQSTKSSPISSTSQVLKNLIKKLPPPPPKGLLNRKK